jgi:ribosomal protein S18 acetylase RimI-like enzyme
MEEGLRIRQGFPEDWEKILPLFTQLYHGDIGPNLRKVFARLSRGAEGVVMVAELNGKFVGSVIGSYCLDLDWEGKIARLQAIIVDEKHRGRGIGEAMLHRFLVRAKESSCRAVVARVNRKNRKGGSFFEKLNFEEAGTSEYFLEL